jgi:oligopeptide transport system substrate-binding protein
MIRLLTILFFLAALATAAVVWSGGVTGSGDRADLSFVNRGDTKTLDINTMSWMQDIRLAYALWEGLYTLDPVTLKPILGTADRTSVNASHTVWTFHIRDSARWSNGDPVTSSDFLFSWRRFLETPGEYTYLHDYIRGAQQYSDQFAAYVAARHKGDASAQPPDFASVGEKAIDDHTLQVTLTDPIPFFPALCAFPCFFPMHRQSMQPFGQADPDTGVVTYNERFTRPPYLVTNGPYRLAEWSFKRRMRLIASDYYWDRAHVQSRVIDELSYEDTLAAFRAYERGEIDWLAAPDSDPELCTALLSKGNRTDLHIFPAFGTDYYSLNCLPKLPGNRPNPLADVRVRKALGMALDKSVIVRECAKLNQPVARDYIPPGVFDGYVSPPGLPYDIPAAQKLLADAGYPGGKNFPQLTILFNNEIIHADVALVIQSQWQSSLGIHVDLQGIEVKVFGVRHHTQDYDIARASWFGDYDDPTTFTDKFKSTSDDNECKWANAEYDRLCAQAQVETNIPRRLALLSRAENILLNEAPIIPLFTYVNAYLYRDNVQGIPLTPNAMQMFKSIRVVR